MTAVRNWIDEAGLRRMLANGWTIVERTPLEDERRTLVRLRHAGDGVETFRSLHLDVADAVDVDQMPLF